MSGQNYQKMDDTLINSKLKMKANLEERVVKLERALLQTKQSLKSKEMILELQKEQLQKLEKLYKDALDKNENLSFHNRRTNHDLENLKIILEGFEAAKSRHNTNLVRLGDVARNNSENLDLLPTKIGKAPPSFLTLQELMKSLAKTKDSSQRYNNIFIVNESTGFCKSGEHDNHEDCDPKWCPACEKNQAVIETLEVEIDDLREQINNFKISVQTGKRIVQDVIQKSKEYLEHNFRVFIDVEEKQSLLKIEEELVKPVGVKIYLPQAAKFASETSKPLKNQSTQYKCKCSDLLEEKHDQNKREVESKLEKLKCDVTDLKLALVQCSCNRNGPKSIFVSSIPEESIIENEVSTKSSSKIATNNSSINYNTEAFLETTENVTSAKKSLTTQTSFEEFDEPNENTFKNEVCLFINSSETTNQSSKTEENTEMCEEVEKLRQENCRFKEDCGILSKKNEALVKENKILEEENAVLKEENGNLKKEVEGSKKLLEVTNEEIEILNNEIEALYEEKKMLNEEGRVENEDLLITVENLKVEIGEKQKEIDHLNEELKHNNLKEIYENEDARNGSQEFYGGNKNNQERTSKLFKFSVKSTKVVKNKSSSSKSSSSRELENVSLVNTSKSPENTCLCKKKGDLIENLQKLNEEIHSNNLKITADLNNARKENQAIIEELKKLKEEKVSYSRVIYEQVQKIDRISAEKQKLQEKLLQLQKLGDLNKKLVEEKEELNLRIKTLSHINESLNTQIGILKEDFKNLEAKITQQNVRDIIEDFTSKISVINQNQRKKFSDHSIKDKKLIEEAAKLKEDYLRIIKDNKSLIEENDILGKNVSSLYEENKSLKEEMKKLLGEVGDLKDRVVKLDETSLKNQIVKLEEENASLIKENSCLRREIDCLCEERQFLSKNLKTCEDNLAKNNNVEEIGKKNDLEEVIRILNEDNAAIVKENEYLGKKNVNLGNEIVKLREEMKLLQQIPEDLDDINANRRNEELLNIELSESNSRLLKSNENLLQINEEMMKEKEVLLEQNMCLCKDNKKIADENEDLKKANEILKKENEDLVVNGRECVKEFENFARDLEELQKSNEVLTEENEESKEKLKKCEEIAVKNEILEETLEDLFVKNEELKKSEEILKKQIEECLLKKSMLQETNEVLSNENKGLKGEITDLKLKLDTSIARNEETKMFLNVQIKTYDLLRDEFDELEINYNNSIKNNNTKEENEQLLEDIKILKTDKLELIDELKALRFDQEKSIQIFAEYRNKTKQHEAYLLSQLENYTNFRKKCSKLIYELYTISQTCDCDYSNDLKNEEVEPDVIIDSLKNLCVRLKNLVNDTQNLEKTMNLKSNSRFELDSLTLENERLKQKITNDTELINDLDLVRMNLEEELREKHCGNCRKFKEENVKLKEELLKMKENYVQVLRKHQELSKNFKNEHCETSKLQLMIADLKRINGELQEVVHELKLKNSKLGVENNLLSNSKLQLESRFSEISCSNLQLESTISTLKTRITDLERNLKVFEEQRLLLENECGLYKRKLDRIETRISKHNQVSDFEDCDCQMKELEGLKHQVKTIRGLFQKMLVHGGDDNTNDDDFEYLTVKIKELSRKIEVESKTCIAPTNSSASNKNLGTKHTYEEIDDEKVTKLQFF